MRVRAAVAARPRPTWPAASPRSSWPWPPGSSGTGGDFPSGPWPPPVRSRPGTVLEMDVETAIRSRRTHKAFRPDPVPQSQLDQLFELARWAPNHNLTNPWRFRVVGPRALEGLKRAAGPEAAPKLDRAPTLVVCSCVLSGDPVQDEEDLHATACAAYIVLLGAHARGLAGYWRTPEVLRTPGGCSAAGVPDGERAIGLLHLGPRRQDKEPPE